MAATLTAALVGLMSASMAAADGVNDLPPVTDAEVLAAISDIELHVSDIEILGSVEDVEQVQTQGTETVVTLTSDILFSFGKADLPAAAAARIIALATKVPRAGALSVGGHTDNVGTPAANLALSRTRAAAVAAVIAKARPDIKLSVQGFGESKPIEANTSGGKDNPESRAKNRRVELRYKS